MRNNQPVTDDAYLFSDDQQLISSTDTKGVIRHCNHATSCMNWWFCFGPERPNTADCMAFRHHGR